MAVNKVIYDARVLIDLTADTVTPEVLKVGYTAHQANGAAINGSLMSSPLETYVYDFRQGYINSGGRWVREIPTNTLVDIYKSIAGHRYLVALGGTVGSRFRSMFTTNDVSVNNVNTTGTEIIYLNNPAPYRNVTTVAFEEDGYILVAKDNVGVTGLYSYVYDITLGWL